MSNIIKKFTSGNLLKKTVIFSVVLGLALSAAGCSSKGTSAGATSSSPSSAPSKAPAETPKSARERVVKIGYPGANVFPGDLLGIAQEKGFLKEELEKIGVKVEYVPFEKAGPAVNEALVSKSIDVAAYADVPALVLKSKGANITTFAINNNSFNVALVVKNGSPIKSVKDLKGKKIAFIKGTVIHRFVLEALKANGLTPNDVQLIDMASDAESALISGNVDALANTSSSIGILAKTKKVATIIEDSQQHPDWAGFYLSLARDEYIKENPDVISAIIRGYNKSRDFVRNNKEEAYKIWTKAGLDLDSVKYVYGFDEKFDYFPVQITDQSIKKLGDIKKFLLDEKLIKDDFDIAKSVDKSFYEKAGK